MAALEPIVGLKILRKLIKLGNTSKITATLDDQPLVKTDVDFHLLHVDLEAWREEPKEYYRCEFPVFHLNHPDLEVNGEDRYKEKVDVDLHGDNVTFELRFADKPDGTDAHLLKFEYPFV